MASHDDPIKRTVVHRFAGLGAKIPADFTGDELSPQTAPDVGRPTPERLAEIRQWAALGHSQGKRLDVRELLAEIDAVTRDLDEARKVTDAMVERAANALYETPVYDFNRAEAKDIAHRALAAALGQP